MGLHKFIIEQYKKSGKTLLSFENAIGEN